MTDARRYLSSVRRLNILIEQRKLQKQELEMLAKWPYPVAIKIIQIIAEVEQIIYSFSITRDRITEQIQNLEDPVHKRLLFLHYVEGKKMCRISQEMCYSEDYMKKLHKAALMAFEKKYLMP